MDSDATQPVAPTISMDELNPVPVIIPPPPISLNDILSSIEVITQKEKDDKALLEGLATMPYDTLKTKLVSWATIGFPNVYEIQRLVITPPPTCSDGASRSLADYIEFCSGKTMQEHVAGLQSRVQDMVITFANMGSYIAVVVSRA